MTTRTGSEEEPRPIQVGDLVRPVGRPNATPRKVTEVHTTYRDDFDTPLPNPIVVVNGGEFLPEQLEVVDPESGTKRDTEAGR